MDIPLEASSLTKGVFCKLLMTGDLRFCFIHTGRSRKGSDLFNGNGVYFSFLQCPCVLDHFSFTFVFFLSVFALFDLHGGDFWAEIDLRILIGGAYCTCLMDTSGINITHVLYYDWILSPC